MQQTGKGDRKQTNRYDYVKKTDDELPGNQPEHNRQRPKGH